MKRATNGNVPLVAVLACAVLLCGCAGGRPTVHRIPYNDYIRPAEVLAAMADSGAGPMAEIAGSAAQNVCMMNLGKDFEFAPRHHVRADVTLVAVRGTAIVKVEERRYSVGPGEAVFVPHGTRYAVLPHGPAGGDGDPPGFAALLISSPPYDPGDIVLEE